MRPFSDISIAAVTLVALVCGAWLLRGGAETHAPPQPSAAQARRGDAHADRPTAAPLAPALPDRVRIPSLGVDAPLTGLGLTPRGSLDVPSATGKNLAGWYESGITPGEKGTAIVAGHVDNAEGPAVFYRLGALRKGSTIEVARRDGTVALFSVDAVEVYDARDFPDEKVYGAALRPELRVITCGGGYSAATGYQGNVVVFAHLTGSRLNGDAITGTARSSGLPPSDERSGQ
ncbi:class F sortase [Streptomyces sp. NPDC050704]|uniref:class F sortase n=1 Tax=Streptomyces sp. NPDC050704 TaxID=3157219 RepID=UPI0034386A98